MGQAEQHSEMMKVLMEIKEDIGGIKQHLKNLNGTVGENKKAISKHKDDMETLTKDTNEKITKIKVTLGKYAGGIAVALIILNAILFNAGSAI